MRHTLSTLAQEAGGPAELVRRYALLLGGWMSASGFRDGCPISTTLLETAPECDAIRGAGEAALADWALVFSRSLEAQGVPPPRARRLASMAIAAIEGSLTQARVAVRQQPVLDAAEEVAMAFDAAIEAARAGARPRSATAREKRRSKAGGEDS